MRDNAAWPAPPLPMDARAARGPLPLPAWPPLCCRLISRLDVVRRHEVVGVSVCTASRGNRQIGGRQRGGRNILGTLDAACVVKLRSALQLRDGGNTGSGKRPGSRGHTWLGTRGSHGAHR